MWDSGGEKGKNQSRRKSRHVLQEEVVANIILKRNGNKIE